MKTLVKVNTYTNSEFSFTAQSLYLYSYIENLEQGLSVSVSWYHAGAGQWRTFPSVWWGAMEWSGQVAFAGNTLFFELGSSLMATMQESSKPIYVTMEYTKTT